MTFFKLLFSCPSPLFKVYKKVVKFSFTPAKNILVFSFRFRFQLIQWIDQKSLKKVVSFTNELHVCSQLPLPIMDHVKLYTIKKLKITMFCEQKFTLRPEGLEIIQTIPDNCIRNPKMGSKQSITGATQYYFFQKTNFGGKK